MSSETGPSPRAEDPPRYVNIAGRRFRVPASRRIRIAAGTLLVIGGILGFLPVLGFWMVPLGLVILSVDMPAVRRLRRRVEVWLGRRRNGQRRNGRPASGG